MATVANQKWIRIHKPRLNNNFLTISNADWMTANKILTPYGLQLYLFLAANADGYQFALSPEHAEQSAGIRRTTFYEYLRKLEICGYLVLKVGNVYDFYTSPRPANERTHPDKHASEKIVFDDDTPSEQAQSSESARQKENPQGESINPQTERFCSHSDIEINNKYRDKQQKITETNSGGVSANAEPPASIAKASKPIVYDGFVF